MTREIFKDAGSVRSGLSHVPSQAALLRLCRDPGGMLSLPMGVLSRNDEPPDIWDTHDISGNVCVNPHDHGVHCVGTIHDEIKVAALPARRYSVRIGGSILSTLSTFQ